MENRKAGHIDSLLAIALVGIVSGIAVTQSYSYRVRTQAPRYAIERYGDRVAPLTAIEEAEWYYDMGVEEGKTPDFYQLEHFRNNCKDKVFF